MLTHISNPNIALRSLLNVSIITPGKKQATLGYKMKNKAADLSRIRLSLI
jgi:hypothetical protein